MYESRQEPLLAPADFAARLLKHLGTAVLLLALSLGLGMAGCMRFEHPGALDALDAFLDSAMLLAGMGPVHIPVSRAGKFFAGCYALYAGPAFIVTAALVVSPVLHRILHRFSLRGG